MRRNRDGGSGNGFREEPIVIEDDDDVDENESIRKNLTGYFSGPQCSLPYLHYVYRFFSGVCKEFQANRRKNDKSQQRIRRTLDKHEIQDEANNFEQLLGNCSFRNIEDNIWEISSDTEEHLLILVVDILIFVIKKKRMSRKPSNNSGERGRVGKVKCVVLPVGREKITPYEIFLPSFFQKPEELLKYCSNLEIFHDPNGFGNVDLCIKYTDDKIVDQRFEDCVIFNQICEKLPENEHFIRWKGSSDDDDENKMDLDVPNQLKGVMILTKVKKNPFGIKEFNLNEFYEQVKKNDDKFKSNFISHNELYVDNDVDMKDEIPESQLPTESIQQVWEKDLSEQKHEIIELKKRIQMIEGKLRFLEINKRKENVKLNQVQRKHAHKLRGKINIQVTYRYLRKTFDLVLFLTKDTPFKYLTELIRFELRQKRQEGHFLMKEDFSYEIISGEPGKKIDSDERKEKSVGDVFGSGSPVYVMIAKKILMS